MTRSGPSSKRVQPSYPTNTSIRQATRPQTPLREASNTLMYIVRDMLACSVIMWLVTYLYSHGDLLFARLSQSDSQLSTAKEVSFVFAVLAYTSLFSAILTTLVQSSALIAFHFTRSPTRKSTLRLCLCRVLRFSFVGYLISLVGIAGSAALLNTRWSVIVRKYVLHYYCAGFFLFFYYVVVDNAGRHVYLTETVEGTTRARTRTLGTPHRSYWRSFAGTMLKDKWHLGLIYLAGGYVYIASSLTISQTLPSILFSAVSMAMKMAVQELIKRSVMRHRARGNIYAIYLSIVGITVLMDTQVRVALIRMSGSSVTATLVQAVALAPVEIIARFARAHHLRLQIARRERSMCGQGMVHVAPVGLGQAEPRRQQQQDFEQWKKGVMRINAAEIHAVRCVVLNQRLEMLTVAAAD